MAGELALDKIRLRMNIPVVLERKIDKKFRHNGDKSILDAFLRALHESVSDVTLTPADYRKIAKRIEDNRITRYERRMAAKMQKDSKKPATTKKKEKSTVSQRKRKSPLSLLTMLRSDPDPFGLGEMIKAD